MQQTTPQLCNDIRPVIDQLIETAVARQASDIHIEPTAAGCEVRLRIDGLLQLHEKHTHEAGRVLVTRFMVLAKLLTYRPDVPQEGRATVTAGDRSIDIRISIMPTTHGPRSAIRLPAELIQPRTLDELNLPPGALAALKQFASTDAGMLIVTGPAGSGKTTTAYALLQHIATVSPGLSIVSLEDPVERDIPGVTQIEVTPFGERTYERSLRSLLRQDPQVLMLGEIRDTATASLAVQAALSGHRLICSLHASTPGGAVARMLEMGIEPYQMTSSLAGVLAQRLLRKRASDQPGYLGRTVIAEFAAIDAPARAAILGRADAGVLQENFTAQDGYVSLRDAADALVTRGTTDAAEVTRVLGEAADSPEKSRARSVLAE